MAYLLPPGKSIQLVFAPEAGGRKENEIWIEADDGHSDQGKSRLNFREDYENCCEVMTAVMENIGYINKHNIVLPVPFPRRP